MFGDAQRHTYGYLPSRRALPTPLTGTRLYCLVTEAHECEQLAQGCYLKAKRPKFEPATFRIQVQRSNH